MQDTDLYGSPTVCWVHPQLTSVSTTQRMKKEYKLHRLLSYSKGLYSRVYITNYRNTPVQVLGAAATWPKSNQASQAQHKVRIKSFQSFNYTSLYMTYQKRETGVLRIYANIKIKPIRYWQLNNLFSKYATKNNENTQCLSRNQEQVFTPIECQSSP